jgi:hypothetical protein
MVLLSKRFMPVLLGLKAPQNAKTYPTLSVPNEALSRNGDDMVCFGSSAPRLYCYSLLIPDPTLQIFPRAEASSTNDGGFDKNASFWI